MSAAAKRSVRREVARHRQLTLWMRRMMRRRGGFLILACDMPRDRIPDVRFMQVIRETNAPRALRSLFVDARRVAA